MIDWYGEALELSVLREQAMKQSKGLLCPSCNTDQVQLVNGWDVEIRWKCRICKHKFETTRK